MKKSPALLLLLALLTLSLAHARAAENAEARELADAVWKAAGGEHWPEVKTIDFTFAVEKNGKIVARAQHHWDVPAQTDRVQWKGQDVTVNLANPGEAADAKSAYARWVNDSYWLLAPLKLRDHGLHLAYEGTKEMEGAKREVLHLRFDKVGLTPTDQYRLYIDPATKLVTSWDYMPESGDVAHGTWENYKKTGGLNLATEHTMGSVKIKILDLNVATAR